MMEESHSSKMSVVIQWSTWCYISEGLTINSHYFANFRRINEPAGVVAMLQAYVQEESSLSLYWDNGYPECGFLWLSSVPPW
jgi:hypothetical protein